MNTTVAKTKTETFDPETGEVSSGLPVGYNEGNQSLAISIARAEIDQQITTAHAFPRSVAQAVSNILALATLDEETAKECIYALPRGGKPIKGPSIRLAEIIQSQWGNNRVGTRVVHVDRIEKYVEAEGVFHDLETNAATSSRVKRRLSNRENQLLNEDMIIVTGNAASSIAKRNAILAGVPKAVWRRAYAAVERVLVGDIKTMAEKREDALKAFAGFGITPEQIYEILEIGGLDDIGPDEYTTLIGMHQALRNNEATVEEMFPPKRKPGKQSDKPKDLNSKLDALAKGDQKNSGAGKSSPAGSEGSGKQNPAQATAAEPKPSPERPNSGDGTNPNSAQTRNHAAETTSAEKSSGSRLPEDEAASGDTPEPDAADPIAAAHAKGVEARAKGLSRKAVPSAFRNDEHLLQAYLDGFDSGEGD